MTPEGRRASVGYLRGGGTLGDTCVEQGLCDSDQRRDSMGHLSGGQVFCDI